MVKNRCPVQGSLEKDIELTRFSVVLKLNRTHFCGEMVMVTPPLLSFKISSGFMTFMRAEPVNGEVDSDLKPLNALF